LIKQRILKKIYLRFYKSIVLDPSYSFKNSIIPIFISHPSFFVQLFFYFKPRKKKANGEGIDISKFEGCIVEPTIKGKRTVKELLNHRNSDKIIGMLSDLNIDMGGFQK